MKVKYYGVAEDGIIYMTHPLTWTKHIIFIFTAREVRDDIKVGLCLADFDSLRDDRAYEILYGNIVQYFIHGGVSVKVVTIQADTDEPNLIIY